MALELFDDVGPLDLLLVCCGGGGLLSGCALAAAGRSPGCRVIGVEPEAGDDATRSFQTKTLQKVRNPQTVADGARTPSLGALTFPLVLSLVSDMQTVSDVDLLQGDVLPVGAPQDRRRADRRAGGRRVAAERRPGTRGESRRGDQRRQRGPVASRGLAARVVHVQATVSVHAGRADRRDCVAATPRRT